MEEQLDLFASSFGAFEPRGKLRLIELFAGIGAQARALENLGIDFVSHRVCEWSCKSIKAYRAIHCKNAPTSEIAERVGKMSTEELIEAVRGVSMDYNKPMTDTELSRKGREWLADLYTDMLAIGDTCPDVSKLKGSDMDIERERESRLVPDDIFLPLPIVIQCRKEGRYGKGTRYPFGTLVGSREDTIRTHRDGT